MKKVIILVTVLLGACSSKYSPNTIKMSQNVEQIPTNTVIAVISENSYRVPKGTQIIEKSGIYKTIDNIYDEDGNEVLIPRNAVIRGVYINDGVTCKVVWKSIYKDMDDYYNDQGSFSLASNTVPSRCNPTKGIKSGSRATIRFK